MMLAMSKVLFNSNTKNREKIKDKGSNKDGVRIDIWQYQSGANNINLGDEML